MNRKYDYIFFDMDGTVLNTLEDLCDCVNFALRLNGMPVHTLEDVRRFVGNGIPKLIERAVPEGTAAADAEKVYAAFTARYQEHCRDKTCPYKGIPELLNRLKEEGFCLAVVSNKDEYAVKELSDFYFPGLFAAAAGRTDAIPKKPAPDMVLRILEQWNAPKSRAVFIGDSDVDLATAHNAGMDCISVLWGFRDRAFLEAHGADRFATFPEDIPGLIGCGDCLHSVKTDA